MVDFRSVARGFDPEVDNPYDPSDTLSVPGIMLGGVVQSVLKCSRVSL
jgi:hypothetical protein